MFLSMQQITTKKIEKELKEIDKQKERVHKIGESKNIQTSKKKIQHNTQPKGPTKPHNSFILRQNRKQIRCNAKSPRK